MSSLCDRWMLQPQLSLPSATLQTNEAQPGKGCTDAGLLGLQVWDKISARPLALLVAGWEFLCSIVGSRPALWVGAAGTAVRVRCCDCSYPRALPGQKNVGRGGGRGV